MSVQKVAAAHLQLIQYQLLPVLKKIVLSLSFFPQSLRVVLDLGRVAPFASSLGMPLASLVKY